MLIVYSLATAPADVAAPPIPYTRPARVRARPGWAPRASSVLDPAVNGAAAAVRPNQKVVRHVTSNS